MTNVLDKLNKKALCKSIKIKVKFFVIDNPINQR